MIQVYNGFNTDFNKNGRILNNVSSCYIIEELNGAYYLELEHYKDKQGKYKELKGWNVIKVDGQLFRIPYIENIQEDNIKIKVTAYHIFYDLLNDFIEDRRVENSTVENALRTAIEINPKFTVGECDIESINTAYFIKENPVKAIFDKILPRWGGELYRNNYEIAIKKNIGEDTGILIKYGKNIKGFKEHIDYTGVATRILPIGKNGLTIELVNGGDKYLYSPRRQGYLFPVQPYQEYPFEATKEVKFEEIEDATELKNEAMKLWGTIDVPKVTYEINLIDLSKTVEYKDLKDLYTLKVGDTVIIRHEIFNIDIIAKVIKTKKNVLTGVLEEIVLGNYKDNFAKTINNIGKSLSETQTYIEKVDNDLQGTKTIVLQNQEQISLQAQNIDELGQRISEAELKITPNAIVSTVRSSTEYINDLNNKANNSDVSTLSNRVSATESSITQLSDEIDLKVDKDGIISSINMSPETIQIAADKINLNGYVTVNDLQTQGATTINGDNITTGKIDADRIIQSGGIVPSFYPNIMTPTINHFVTRLYFNGSSFSTSASISLETHYGDFKWDGQDLDYMDYTGWIPSILVSSSYYNVHCACYQIYFQNGSTGAWSWQAPNYGYNGYINAIKVAGKTINGELLSSSDRIYVFIGVMGGVY